MSTILSRLRRKKKSINRSRPNKLKPHAAIKSVAKAVEKVAEDVAEAAVEVAEVVEEAVEAVAEVAEDVAEVAEAVAAVDLSILEGTISSLKEALASGAHDASLDALIEAEKAGSNRKGALAALEERL